MALGRRKRENAAEVSRQAVEDRLDHMHATRAERDLARGVFRQLMDGPDRPPLRTIERRAVGAVVRDRRAREHAPIKSEMT